MHTWQPILSLLYGCDGLAVTARSGQVKDPDGLVIACPYVASTWVDGQAEGCSHFISCIVGSIDASQAAGTGIPKVNGMSLQQ